MIHKLIAALAFTGAILSGFLSRHYHSLRSGDVQLQSVCNLGQAANCDVVALSRFAEIFPGIPLSSVVTGWLISLAIFSLLKWKKPVFVLALVGALFSVFNFFVMAFWLKTFCIFCIGIEISCFVILALSYFNLKKNPKSEANHPIKPIVITTAICVFLSVVLFKGQESAEFNKSDTDLLVRSILSGPVQNMGDLAGLPVLGKTDAPITLVEFSDFQCPYCAKGAALGHLLLNTFPNKVRIVFRNFPLDSACNRQIERPFHAASCEAAKVVLCAQEQNQFESVYMRLFEQQSELKPGKVISLLDKLPVSQEQLSTCMKDPKTEDRLQKDLSEGERLGLRSTPTFFLNGRKIEGALPPQVWIRLIESL